MERDFVRRCLDGKSGEVVVIRIVQLKRILLDQLHPRQATELV